MVAIASHSDFSITSLQMLFILLMPQERIIVRIILKRLSALSDDARSLAVSKALEMQGFLVAAIRPPTVPAGTARLRVTFSAIHEESQVDALIDAMTKALAA